jgi:uncharacterized integral membrane protein
MAYNADKFKSSKAKSLTLLTYLSDYSVQCSVFSPSMTSLLFVLTSIGLTPGGNSTIHIYTQTVHRIQRTEHT